MLQELGFILSQAQLSLSYLPLSLRTLFEGSEIFECVGAFLMMEQMTCHDKIIAMVFDLPSCSLCGDHLINNLLSCQESPYFVVSQSDSLRNSGKQEAYFGIQARRSNR